MKNVKPRVIMICALSLAFLSPAYAVLPVIDMDGLIAMVEQMKNLQKQYQELQALKDRAEKQINKTEELISNTSGQRDIGKLLNSLDDLKQRQWSPSKWDDALQGLSGGNPARYQELVKQYEKNQIPMQVDEYRRLTNDTRAKEYSKMIDVNRAASTAATYEYEQINTHMENIHKLSKQIEHAGDIKDSQDLTARLQAEVAYTNVMVARQIVILNQQLAGGQSLDIAARAESAEFNRLPNRGGR